MQLFFFVAKGRAQRAKRKEQSAESKGNVEITGTQEELKEILFQMITREINMEGTRLMYLKYFDKAESILGIPTYKNLLPIPLKQLIYNPYMTQNPGY